MQINESIEDYLEAVLRLKERLGLVRSIDVAEEMGYSKPSVSIAMKKLRENGYVEVDGEGHLSLTTAGMNVAKKVDTRHKVLKDIFIRLGVSEETAAKDACEVEHHLSDETFQKLREFMNGCEKCR